MATESISFDRAVEYYDQTRGFPPGEDAHAVMTFVRAGALTAASRVLEIGIGTGRIAVPLSAHVGRYTGIDISRGMMDKLRVKPAARPIQLVQGDATQLPFAPASFDAVVAVHVFHLIPGWRQVLAELTRTLHPDGLLMHGWNDRTEDNALRQFWEKLIQSDGGDPRPGVHWDEYGTFLGGEGWTAAGEAQQHSYVIERSPQQFLEAIRGRQWSHTWQLTDAQLEAHVREVQAFIDAHYDDPTRPLTTQATFNVQAYRPPSRD